MMPEGAPQEDPNEPYPGMGSALILTLMAIFASIFTGVALYAIGPLAAYGIGRAIGVGAVATMATQRVGPPQARRLGMARLDSDAVPLILCLVPAMLLASELDNIAYDWSGEGPTLAEQLAPPPEAPPGVETSGETAAAPSDESLDRRIFDPADPVSLTQALIVLVGIIPLVDCFLFFGVIQQGLVRRMGLSRGLLVTAILWTLMRQIAPSGALQFIVATLAYIGLGHLLGLLRIATGSVVGPMLLSSGWAAVQFVALATYDRIPLPGLNEPGTHLPLLVTVGCVGIVAWAGSTLFNEAMRRYAEDDVWRGPGPGGGRPRRREPSDEDPGAEIHPFPPVPRPRHLDRPDDDEVGGA